MNFSVLTAQRDVRYVPESITVLGLGVRHRVSQPYKHVKLLIFIPTNAHVNSIKLTLYFIFIYIYLYKYIIYLYKIIYYIIFLYYLHVH